MRARPKIQQFHPTARTNQYISRFEIAVDDQFAVSVAHRGANIQEKPKPGFQVEIVLTSMDRQRRTIDEFHDEIRLTIFSQAAIEQTRDSGMFQAGGE